MIQKAVLLPGTLDFLGAPVAVTTPLSLPGEQ